MPYSSRHEVVSPPLDLYIAANYYYNPVDNFETVVGENPTPYGILALWAVNGLSIVYWEACHSWPIFFLNS